MERFISDQVGRTIILKLVQGEDLLESIEALIREAEIRFSGLCETAGWPGSAASLRPVVSVSYRIVLATYEDLWHLDF